MPHIDITICQLCYGSRRIITATIDGGGIAGTIKPCSCASGIEAVTDDGEVIPVGDSGGGKLSHHAEPMDR